jgi:deoxyribodipyrimidine photo-lyase
VLNIFWFRRDLRLEDNAGLYSALTGGNPVLPVFIFDENILQKLEDHADARITFLYDKVKRLKDQLEKIGSSLLIKFGKPEIIFAELIDTWKPSTVFANHDYEPYARERDTRIERLLKDRRVNFRTFKDQVIFEKDEVVKDSGEPYTVFTPYSRKWKGIFRETEVSFFPSWDFTGNFYNIAPLPLPALLSLGFERALVVIPSGEIEVPIIKDYHLTRDYPALHGTSRLGVHLRFGTISIRQLVKTAAGLNEVFLNELIWREFYMMILWHFPRVVDQSFKPQYDLIAWRNDEKEFSAWCKGETGYPIVDAGMRELNHTGYMHNRLRMITASFLAKHLLIDWRWGEAYFAKKLLDYELASNNGGWQWAAGTGCDAAPYFRVFNPDLQTAKFDPDNKYIRKWVPEFDSEEYTGRIVNHSEARNNAISAYKKALEKKY